MNLVKPEPEIYQYLLREFQLKPDSCVFIDDSPTNITAAENEGIQGIVFDDLQSCREQLFAVLGS